MTMKKEQTKLWAGRFAAATDRRVEAFTESLSFDQRLAAHDIAGSCAHADMLARVGIIGRAEAKRIIAGLRAVERDIASGRVALKPEWEDIHMAVETLLTQRIGPVAKKLHTGRSRNDQVALDERLWLRGTVARVMSRIGTLQGVLVSLAKRNADVVMPGFTHLQYAVPVLAAHHLLSYVEMLERDRQRLCDLSVRVDAMPLGAAALAGSSLPLDRGRVARVLGFSGVTANSMDSVADRDCLLEFLAAAAIAGMHLSRLCEDFIIWASQPFGFIELADAFCTGSSLMPNKKNPDVLELVRGKCGRLYGNLMALLTVMKGLPMAYNRDMQEDKEPVFDSADTLEASLETMAGAVRSVAFKRGRIAAAVGDSFLLATDWVEHLVRKGVAFRAAHEMVGKAVARAGELGCALTALPRADLKRIAAQFDPGVLKIKTAAASVAAKRTAGSTNPAMVRRAIEAWKEQRGLATKARSHHG